MRLPELSDPTNTFSSPDLLLIAGEHSGDAHAAELVKALKAEIPALSICALGGKRLQEAGAQLVFDLTFLSVVGLFEVLKHYSSFKKLLAWVLRWIQVNQPKAICLVDFPGFNLRLAKLLYEKKLSHKAGGKTKVFYYISPQIWAWKSKRRFAMAKYLDSLGVIFPFEKDCFQDTELEVNFVGHPFTHKRLPLYYVSEGPLVLLPGSRQAAVKRIFPLLIRAFECLKDWYQCDKALVLYPDNSIKSILEKTLRSRNHTRYASSIQLQCLTEGMTPEGVSGALMSSGTASLMVSLAGIPGVIAYKANPFTYLCARWLVKVPYLSMANILLKEQAYPELLQSSSIHHVEIADAMASYLSEPEKAREQFSAYAQRLHALLQDSPHVEPASWLKKSLLG